MKTFKRGHIWFVHELCQKSWRVGKENELFWDEEGSKRIKTFLIIFVKISRSQKKIFKKFNFSKNDVILKVPLTLSHPGLLTSHPKSSVSKPHCCFVFRKNDSLLGRSADANSRMGDSRHRSRPRQLQFRNGELVLEADPLHRGLQHRRKRKRPDAKIRQSGDLLDANEKVESFSGMAWRNFRSLQTENDAGRKIGGRKDCKSFAGYLLFLLFKP